MGPPAQFRPIQPAPVRGIRPGTSSGNSWLGTKGLTKRVKAVTLACYSCRRNKAKCDGVRPRCGGCTTRDSQCGYEGEAGQSRQAALRGRLEVLEKLVVKLQSVSEQDADRLLQQVRAAEDIAAICSIVESEDHQNAAIGNSATRLESSPTHQSREASPHSTTFKSRSDTLSIAASSAPTAVTSTPGALQRLNAEELAGLLHWDLPSSEATWKGFQCFYNSCGNLFHVFSREQMEGFYRTVFNADGRVDTSQKLAICFLCACASVGIQYNPGLFPKGLEKSFHDVSRRFFFDVLEVRPLDAVKVCTLFAMYNILDKATVALAYVEIGLSMSRRQSQSSGACHASMLSPEEASDFRRTWRALIFFSSWLSSTLGYISGVEDADSEFTQFLPAEIDYDSYGANELGELVQLEITKISLLKAGILRNHLVVQELTTLSMDGISKELQDWHGQLPEPMKLRSLCRDDWPPLVRWSLYHVHMLYHGAFMLVYRRIATHCIRLHQTGTDVASTQEPTLLNLVEQGITSAQDTARIVTLLLEEQGVFRRCWIVIFQAHTACVAILHSVAQKQLHRFPPSSWEEDMNRAQQCIDVLGYCGLTDPVALRFRVQLSSIFDSLADYPAYHPDYAQNHPEPNTAPPHPITYLFTTPPSPSPELQALSLTLLFALCKPWSDTTATATNPTGTVSPSLANSSGAGSSAGGNMHDPQFLESLDWDFEKVTPFRWDTDNMGMVLTGQGEGLVANCFLDSESPSGWAGAEDLEVGDGGAERGEVGEGGNCVNKVNEC